MPRQRSPHPSASVAPAGVASGDDGYTCGERTSLWLLSCVDKSVKVIEPILIILAIGLISLDVYTFFKFVIPEITERRGQLVTALHGLWALWLLFNVFFNQFHCAFSSPGTTLEVHEQALQLAMTYDWRWCRKCNRGKPPLSHHCSICNKCVLKMDHHCVWMANCIGFFNYRHFVLFLFWMWVGSLYSAMVYLVEYPLLFKLESREWDRRGFLPFFMFILSASIWLGISALFWWHVWLILTGQGTIDYLDNTQKVADAKAQGRQWVNPYHLGAVANWQETFDVRGRWWWLAWMLPTRRRKLGNGYVLPQVDILVLDKAESAGSLSHRGTAGSSNYV
ncbi:hypothetical protein CHLRE_03g207502v5 [Chlamydomonas reinhardtii]|uniref:S-acyltransferase n=1 Tax=Chlamydomonas reinhardtii TaxID=3055 RepID=A0A2K3DYZ9_CHLRE|nr:uncharacterized protein CHLRE_03g207502v5 [Chlamydomonas reinhardtii]PNW85739.1 hypothetical protein CHLRE_03g207502v5 [Chlamydomonas reinhardtii]